MSGTERPYDIGVFDGGSAFSVPDAVGPGRRGAAGPVGHGFNGLGELTGG
ncbi:hypothetical protein [Streptomyces sp. NPDC056468]